MDLAAQKALSLHDSFKLENKTIESVIMDESEMLLRIFPIGSSGFIGKINVTNNMLKECSIRSEYSTVVLLDRSGSMRGWVRKITRELLPKALLSLGYSQKDKIIILAFDDVVEKVVLTVEDLKNCELRARGGTCMKPAVDQLKSILKEVTAEGNGVRIITISDGQIFDQPQTKIAADDLCSEFKNSIRINSQAIQIFSSSYANPDSIALCSLLQLNNTKSSLLGNIFGDSMSEDEQVGKISDLIKGDGLEFCLELKTDLASLKKNLWDAKFINKLNLEKGENTFWINPSTVDGLCCSDICLTLGKVPVTVILESAQDDLNKVSDLLSAQFKHVFEYLKVLRIVNSDSTKELMINIVQKFQDLESQLVFKEESQISALDVLAITDMSSRMVYLRHEIRKRKAGFSMKMAQIVNDNTIDALNSAQKAEYLQSTTHSRNSRGLAKRAAISGFNFDEIAREEALKIAANLEELLTEIDDSTHQCSFYSMETTLGGIKAVADLTKNPDFEDCTVHDILLLLNIVGIACKGPIGDFPDPMTWRVNEIYPGVFVSISDLMTSRIQSGDPRRNLAVPGHDGSEITCVIPLFEDQRISKFLRKQAPHLISYTCSIGMRGMIAHVVMTDGYTLCAGIWKLVEHVAKNPTELTLNTFKHMVASYELFSGYYFSDSRDCLTVKPGIHGNLSFYLQNNGLTNMIAPIYHQCKSPRGFIKMAPNIPAILRALFSYEFWQMLRREFKGADSDKKISEMLHCLTGIDYEKYSVKLPELFEKELVFSDLEFHDEAHFNFDYLTQLIDSKGYYLKYVLIIVTVLRKAADGTINDLKNQPSLFDQLQDENFIKAQLGLPADYDFKEYLIYSAIQSLMFPKMNDRVDQENSKMFISDLINPPQEVKEMIKNYVKSQYRNRYDFDRVQRCKLENLELVKMFLNDVSICTDRQELIKIFFNGVKISEKTYIYKGFGNLGFIELKNLILNTENCFPLRKEAIKIFLLACDFDDGCVPLFNDGKTAAIGDIDLFQKVFIETCGGTLEEWDAILVEYKIRCIHAYREGKANRHGHHNMKPSFWALGYMTLAAFAKDHNQDEFMEYCRIHHDCCGVNQIS